MACSSPAATSESEDLAVGGSTEDIGGVVDAGAVQVFYGSASGLSSASSQLWSQNTANVEDVAEAGDLFGVSLAAGDFNADGFDDLAIGVPGEDVGAVAEAGAVNVIYGSATGLNTTAIPDQLWSQDSPDIGDVAESGDVFGFALAAADFNADGIGDLAIGVFLEDIASIGDAGAVNVIHGSPAGLSATVVPNQFWSQTSFAVEEASDLDDRFGFALAAGDFNDDTRDDLAIGVPGENVLAGAVNVIYGAATGLSATFVPDQLWSQNTAGVEDVAENGDRFGDSLATGDFNNDGRADLAVGAPSEGLGTSTAVGAVNVVYGSATGLSATFVPDQFWHQDTSGVEETAEAGDFFGNSVATGDFNGDGRDDLAVAVPTEDFGGLLDPGAVNVIYGSATGLSATAIPDQLWHQNTPSVEDAAEEIDFFGISLAAGNFNGDLRDDLAIGGLEDVQDVAGVIVDAGAVNVIYGGSASGLSATIVPDQILTQIHLLPPLP